MAIIQISRIQQRTGNLSEVPQLSPGEFGWADDARRLFIGNEITRSGDSDPNNTEILTEYSNISFSQVASIVNPQNFDVVQYDQTNAVWRNQHIRLTDDPVYQATRVEGNLTITGRINPISNAAVFITGGSSGDVLATDGAGNLSWIAPAAGGGGGGGSTFVIANIKVGNGNITAGNLTVLTASNITLANLDQVLITSVAGTGNLASALNGRIFYLGNVDVANGNVSLYNDLALTNAVSTTGTYTANTGNMTLRISAVGVTGAVQLSDGSGHFTTASGLTYTSGLQTLSSPKLAATTNTDDALTSSGGANIAANITVGLNANVATNLRVGGIANVLGNINVTGNATITANVVASNNVSVGNNLTVTNNVTANGNVAFSGANVSLGNVSNLHITGGTNRIALPGVITVVGNVITNIAVQDGGAGYVSAPTVTITGANTTPATATATIVAGSVTTVTVTGGGTGYNPANVQVSFSLPQSEFLSTDGRGNLFFATASGGGGGGGESPTGSILMWPTGSPPAGYLVCNGANVSRTTYNALFAIIGTAFGIGDGTTTFTLPDYTNRFAVGAGNAYAVGATGGSANSVVIAHTHTAVSNSVFSGQALGVHNHSATSLFFGNTLPAHSHTVADGGHSHSITAPGSQNTNRFGTGFALSTTTGATANTGIATSNLTINSQTAGTPTGTITTTVADSSAGIPQGTVTTSTTINSTGANGVNQNLPPYLGIYFIIKT